MVKVEIPMNTPKGDKDGSEDDCDEVGIMSDIEESDVDDDIGDPDWEEVKPSRDGLEDSFSFKPGDMPNLPKNGITITTERPKRRPKRGKKGKDDSDDADSDFDDEVVTKKKKKSMDLNEMVRKSINRVKITEQLFKHKVSILLYLARGLRLVRIINCNIIRGLSMSIASRFKNSSKTGNRKFLTQFMEQFEKLISLSTDDDVRQKRLQQPFMLNLLECYSNLETTSLIELVVVFTACLKALRPEIPTRIVNVLRPFSLRANIIPKVKEEQCEDKVIKLELPPDKPEEIVEKLDYWVEVYLSDEKRWCCVDLCNLTIDEPSVLTELSRPFYYLVTYDIDRHCVKPAEKNYVENWYTPAFRKGRCEDKWWDSLMVALGPAKASDKDLADESKTEEILVKQDMPKSDNGFRNHPLYVLQKHLLKFQGIYPPEVAPMAYFKDQPVYPRECVHTLRSRETWLRQARSVKLNETAYKVVKARPKRDKYTGDWIRDLPLEVFGEWQTEPYDPPEAVDGQVPRNCYGNVDMYQECMLPKKCKWLKLAGLQRVANKLGIDCAPAVVGFDSNCGSFGSHPVVDGFIVCEEHAETLQMAWEEEQHNIAQREEDKRQKRIWENWKRLLKAARIREKLRVKYQHS